MKSVQTKMKQRFFKKQTEKDKCKHNTKKENKTM